MSHQKPLPHTKDGYRYFWLEDDESLCGEYLQMLNNIDINKRNNLQLVNQACLRRKIVPQVVRLSECDKAPQLKLDDDFTRVTGEKGYSMVRATHGINRGTFYYEVHIDTMPENTATRIGWGQCYGNLQAPLGYDHYGYSWRSRCGTKFHQAQGKTYDKNGGYGHGDTIGCMIELPYGNHKGLTEAHHLPPSIKAVAGICPAKKKDAVHRIGEIIDEPPPLRSMEPLKGSKISFFKNGLPVGVAFEDIFEGFYYPSISLYKNCSVSVNFGPEFKFPPKLIKSETIYTCQPTYLAAQEMAFISTIDHLMADIIFILDKEHDVDGKNSILQEIKNLIKQD